MNEWHPDGDQLERFLGDDMPEEEGREVQGHLFACTACEERLFALLPALHQAGEASPPAPRKQNTAVCSSGCSPTAGSRPRNGAPG